MLRLVSFVLPVLLPSWRFFQSVEPSPRVEWACCHTSQKPLNWREFRPCRTRITPLQMVCSLFWNPSRNANLFIVSCAERIRQAPNDHSIGVIQAAVQSDIREGIIATTSDLIQFRLVFVHREDSQFVRDVVFVSDVFPAVGQ